LVITNVSLTVTVTGVAVINTCDVVSMWNPYVVVITSCKHLTSMSDRMCH